MRGQRKFNQLTMFEDEPVAEQADKIPGRDPELITMRNERLCYRYFYYKWYSPHDYKIVLEILKKEFELSKSTIGQIIELDECSIILARLQRERPNLQTLREKYDWMVWPEALPQSPIWKYENKAKDNSPSDNKG